MKLTGKLESAFNDQVTLETVAALTYEQLAIDMEAIDLPGIASWFRAQADEERVHAGKFIAHMLDRDAHPRYGNMTVEAETVTTVLAAFEASLAHEQKVSEAIRGLYKIAQAEGDIDSLPLLHWFISEQLEEEATVGEIIGRVKLIGEDGTGLLKLDQELGSRPGGELPAAE
ncbi:ferritin [Gulosibacter bifidus]|uniref:Ferritin n=1 Tax=Gulosibacter bifidus TaxID=272239 RepID=A0ABW5RJX0_9MICO|nr:ferritin [Gulosibacter bifidus]